MLSLFQPFTTLQRLNASALSQTAAEGLLGHIANPSINRFSQDKALMRQKLNADVNYQVASTWEDALKQGQKKESQRRQQAIQNGWIFA